MNMRDNEMQAGLAISGCKPSAYWAEVYWNSRCESIQHPSRGRPRTMGREIPPPGWLLVIMRLFGFKGGQH